MGRRFQMCFFHGISEEGMRRVQAGEERARLATERAHEAGIGDKENRHPE